MSSSEGKAAPEGAGESKDGPIKITVPAGDCPVDTVTVFNDRAEVTRVVSLEDADEVGEYEVLVEGLPACVDADSVRVNGTGHVVLSEVSYGVHHKPAVAIEETDDNAGTAEVIQQRLAKLRKEVDALNTRIGEVTRTKTLLASYTTAALNAPRRAAGEGKDDTPPTAAELQAGVDFAFTLMAKQQEKTQEYNLQITELRGQIKAKQALIETAQAQLAGLRRRGRGGTVTSRDVTVVMQVKRPGEVVLKLIYMVSAASWTPAYDARISSTETKVQLTYYGNITQNTGEDWKAAKLILSTATPSVGGVAPVLPTKHVGFYDAVRTERRRKKLHMLAMRNCQAAAWEAASDDSEADEMAGGAVLEEAKAAPVASVATATVKSSGAAATFHIARRSTVASDNKPHKVTVTMIELASKFRYYAVPALQTAAYLQSLTTNRSKFTLLPTDNVNVFLDNSFVSKTSIKLVAPGEKFRFFLGVDKGVKVEYRALSAVHSAKGMFIKTSETLYKFVTVVRNNKPFDIHMIVADMLPVSDDAAIKVRLVNPTAEQVEDGTAAMKASKSGSGDAGDATVIDHNAVGKVEVTGNLVWTRQVRAGTTLELAFEYAVGCAAGRNVVTYTRAQGQ